MLKKTSTLFLLIISVATCKKDSGNISVNLNGTWELFSDDGGWSGHHEFPAGNGNTYTFNKNSYTQKIKNTDTAYEYSGSFKIYKGTPCDQAPEDSLINFDEQQRSNVFSVSGDLFTLSDLPCIADGGSVTYKKVH